MDIIESFGRTGDAASDESDLAKKIDDFVVPRISKYADVAYDQVKARLAADMENPEYRAELQKVVDDAKASAQRGVALTVAATVASTAVLTWALVRYAGGSKRKDD